MTYAMKMAKCMNPQKSSGSGWMVLGIGIGALLGMGIGVLLAPKSGRETMEEIRTKAANTMEDIRSKAASTMENMKSSMQKQADAMKNAAQNAASTVKDAAQDTMETMNQAGNEPGGTQKKTPGKKRIIDLRNTAYEIGQEITGFGKAGSQSKNSQDASIQSGSLGSTLSNSSQASLAAKVQYGAGGLNYGTSGGASTIGGMAGSGNMSNKSSDISGQKKSTG
ncbi:MAG: YtxH domain-containing protein, partial [Eubacteriales bacterium]